jgi:hypothetical protein
MTTNDATRANPQALPEINRPTNFLPASRRAVEDEIERLIGLLDGMDGDENLEAAGDEEPNLGWPMQGVVALDKSLNHDDEREDVSEDEGAITGDDEFSLGWSETASLTGNLSAGLYGIEGELEPGLGWTEEIDQLRRLQLSPGLLVEDGEFDLAGARSDSEDDPAEFDHPGIVRGGNEYRQEAMP